MVNMRSGRACAFAKSSRSAGLGVVAADGVVESTLIRQVAPQQRDGTFGDAVALDASRPPATLELTHVRIEGAARAGVTNFGGDLRMRDSELECNAIHLHGVPRAQPFTFEDLGGNTCGCAGASVECKVLTTDLEPPSVEDVPDP